MSAIASPLVSAAYQAVQQGPANGGKVAGGDKGGFAAMLEDAARSAVETMNNSEKTTMKAAAGEADLLEVVSSVNDAESTLRTVIAVRDKVVQSYQEILRMPI